MKNKGTALITGGAKRVGREIAISLAKCGYNIAVNYNTSKKEAESLKKELENLGVKCEIFKADLFKLKDSKKLFTAVSKKFPDLNLLINNASIFNETKFEQVTEKSFDENYTIHVKTPLILSQMFAESLGRKQGNIINISDSNTRINSIKYFDYMLSKKSLNDLTKQLARALAPNIRVNAIAPGTVLPSKNTDKKYTSEKIKKLPIKSLATVEDITFTISQILQNKAITGHIFYLDGGEHLI